MRQKADYQIYPRSLPSGKKVYYYYAYDHRGKRRPKSTGQTSLTAARNWVNLQLKQGALITSGSTLFADWAADWWIWDRCEYIKSRRGTIGHTHADSQRLLLDKYVLPFFERMKLEAIGPGDIERWIASMATDGKSASVINHSLRTLNTMLNEAERLEYIARNPARTVRRLPEQRKQKRLLTAEEVGDLFDEKNYQKYWKGHIVHYTINLLAASTGLRMGELQALTIDNVYPDHIHVAGSWSRKYGIVGDSEQKRHERDAPIPAKTSAQLKILCDTMGSGWLFTVNRGEPINHSSILKFYRDVLHRAGIDTGARGLTFHSWRHWFNTMMRAQRVPDSMLREVTGHHSAQMTDRYTSFQLEDFTDIVKAQNGRFV